MNLRSLLSVNHLRIGACIVTIMPAYCTFQNSLDELINRINRRYSLTMQFAMLWMGV